MYSHSISLVSYSMHAVSYTGYRDQCYKLTSATTPSTSQLRTRSRLARSQLLRSNLSLALGWVRCYPLEHGVQAASHVTPNLELGERQGLITILSHPTYYHITRRGFELFLAEASLAAAVPRSADAHPLRLRSKRPFRELVLPFVKRICHLYRTPMRMTHHAHVVRTALSLCALRR